MKKLLLLLALCGALRADEVALLEIKFPDGTLRRAAIEFYASDAPATVENFKKLARKGYFTKCAFHRAIAGAIVQTGDPLSKKKSRNAVGTGGPGYTLPAEIRRRHTKGAVAAARLSDKVNLQRRSNGSQFYVCISPQPQLDGKYTVFGSVIQGLDVLETISNKPTDTNDYPIERIVLRKVRIIPREELPAPAAPKKPGAPTEKPPFWRRPLRWPW
jgi:cyclophilin family peptidyl-prolyl cis-trans isomerase